MLSKIKKRSSSKNVIHIKKGLDIPLKGIPKQENLSSCQVVETSRVALTGVDFIGLRPRLMVKEGDFVKKGQALFSDKKNEGVLFTAPASGKVIKINRGPRRVLQAIEIDVDNSEEQIEFEAKSNDVRGLLIESGLWTSFRTRPFSKVPCIKSSPDAIFVTATDTNPLSLNPDLVIGEYLEHFIHGVEFISHLTINKTFVCCGEALDLPSFNSENIEVKRFKGVHPAGNVGTHIHFVNPVSDKKTVWHINYQDVIAIGKLCKTKELWTDRFISLGGPGVHRPSIIKTRIGADLYDLASKFINISPNNLRVISGSVLSGRMAESGLNFLGRYANQVSVVVEGGKRELFGWLDPGLNKFSITRSFISKLIPGKKYSLSTGLNGGGRSLVPIGTYEKVMPLDILPTQLIIALTIQDLDQAVDLGCLELDEEDLSLCTFVCPSKIDFGPLLRKNLTLIEQEG